MMITVNPDNNAPVPASDPYATCRRAMRPELAKHSRNLAEHYHLAESIATGSGKEISDGVYETLQSGFYTSSIAFCALANKDPINIDIFDEVLKEYDPTEGFEEFLIDEGLLPSWG